MSGTVKGADEIQVLIERFGLSLSPYFEGPGAECPVCRATIDQLALTLDITGVDDLTCPDCGGVLAA